MLLLFPIGGRSNPHHHNCCTKKQSFPLYVFQDEYSIANGNKDMPTFDGMPDMEVDRRMKVLTKIGPCLML